MRLLEKRTEVENEIMKMYNTDLHTFAFLESKRIQKFSQISSNFFTFFIFKLNFHWFFQNVIQNSQILMNILRNFCNFYGEDQHLLDSSQISWDFATKIVEIFRKLFFSKSYEVYGSLPKLEKI